MTNAVWILYLIEEHEGRFVIGVFRSYKAAVFEQTRLEKYEHLSDMWYDIEKWSLK